MLSKQDLLNRIEAAQTAFMVAHAALGDIDLDTIDTYDVESLRDYHATAGLYVKELGELYAIVSEMPAIDPEPLGGLKDVGLPTPAKDEPFTDLLGGE